MCGILGSIPKTKTPLFKNALDSIQHRGPDDYGIWDETEEISLGHRRLSILDLSKKGHQPMSYASGRYQIVFNGEIYNFEEIKALLIKKGYSFQSESDTEVILASFVEWKEECVHKFNGMWALAIWDTKNKRLFLSRDRFGKKPLFYSLINNKFVFASEMKAIFPFLDQVKPSEDFQWAVKNIFSYESTDKCLIQGIKRFPAAHYGFYQNGTLSMHRYWNTLDHLVDAPSSYDKQVEEFRNLFFDACKLRMRADVPIGTALSGGLDSSAIISAISHIKNKTSIGAENNWQKAVVASFPNSLIDETPYARQVAEFLNIQAEFVNIDPLKNWHKLEDYFYAVEDIYITPPLPMIMAYEAIKKNGITVSIDGHGADELFSGYGHLIHALWDTKFNPSATLDILSTLKSTQEVFGNQIKPTSYTKKYLSFMTKKSLKKLSFKDNKSKDHNHPQFSKMDNFTKELYILFHETILPTLLRNYDRYSMINSVEIRMPFMDHRLVSYLFSLPYTSKVGGGFTKRLLRDAIAPHLPPEIVYRKSKIGFNSPLIEWMQGPLKEYFQDIASSRDFLECDLIEDSKSLKNKIFAITKKENSLLYDGETMWTAFSPYIWEKAMIRGKR